MSRRRQHLDAALAELRRFDIEPHISNGGKHQRIEWQIPGRPRRVATISGSPSDARGILNLRASIRRALRQDEARPSEAPPPRASTAPPASPIDPLATRVEQLELRIAELQTIIVELLAERRPEKPKPPPIRTIAAENLPSQFSVIWQALSYDQPIALTALAAVLDKDRQHLAPYLTMMKKRGLIRNLSERRGWIRNPLP